jgi:hypothetical protein
MPISQILLTSGGGGPAPTINIYGWTNRINEGSTNTVYVDYEDYPSTTIYWRIVDDGTSNDDWLNGTTPSGSFAINGTGSTSFSWTTAEDLTTEGDQNYLLEVGTTLGSNNLLNETLTINDTSLAPEPPFSLQFVQSQTDYLDVAASADWNLSTTWTIEFWSRAAKVSANDDLLTVMCQNYDVGGGIDLLYIGGQLQLNGTGLASEPTPNIWTHVALVSDGTNLTMYYNGNSVQFGGAVNLNNTTNAIRIGARGPADFQRFDGRLAMIRISNTAKYSAPFTPTVTYGVDADTKLFLSSDTPLVDLSYYELNGVTTVTSSGDTLYFSKATYPNLNNQIRLGNTVVNVDGTGASTSTTTGEVFTPNGDPDNWAVTVFPSQGGGTKNFSGARPRNAITNNGVTESTTFVNRYTATHSALNGGSSGVHIDSNPTNDAWAGSVPVGARIISSVTGRFIVNSRGRDSNMNWVFNIGAGPVFGFTAGETHTFIW